MKNITLLAIIFCIVNLTSFSINAAQSSFNDVFPETQVSPLIEQSFKVMVDAYNENAEILNFCQLNRKHERCGKTREKVASRFVAAKANHETIQMLIENEQFKDQPMPAPAIPDLINSLKVLGYLKENTTANHVNNQTMQAAVNAWLVDKQLPTSDTTYLLHLMLIRADVFEMESKKV